MGFVGRPHSCVDLVSENQARNESSRRVVGIRETIPDRILEIAGVRVDSRTMDRILTDGFRTAKKRNEYCGRSMEVTARMDGGGILGMEAVFCRPCRVVVAEVVVLIC